MNTIFKDFQMQFRHFFEFCERGFINELIINMFARIYEPDLTIVNYGEKFRQVFFICEGSVTMYNKFLIRDFMLLPQYSIFGDYQVICNLKSNITFKTAQHAPQTRFMCVSRKVFMNLCELFPVTADNIKQRGLVKRMHYLKAMERLDRTNPTYKALTRSKKLEETKLISNGKTDSLLDQKTLKALDEAAQRVFTTENLDPGEECLPEPQSVLDEEQLEAFFSDEDDSGISQADSLHNMMKSVSKKAAKMIEGINQCQTRMDSNFRLIKQYLQEGRKPNLDFKRQILPLSLEFVRIAELKWTKEDFENLIANKEKRQRDNAEQRQAQAQDEWKRQLKQIADRKESKYEDQAAKMKQKNETEKVIQKALKGYDRKDPKFVKEVK